MKEVTCTQRNQISWNGTRTLLHFKDNTEKLVTICSPFPFHSSKQVSAKFSLKFIHAHTHTKRTLCYERWVRFKNLWFLMQKELKPGPWKSFKNWGDEKEYSVYIKCRLTHCRTWENAVELMVLLVSAWQIIPDIFRSPMSLKIITRN